jgi:hypothetical protein
MPKNPIERVTKWDRVLWGVELNLGDICYLIGGGWHEALDEERYEGEPPRVILFETRKQAREYCKQQNLKYKASGRLPKRHWRPVRVHELTYICD